MTSSVKRRLIAAFSAAAGVIIIAAAIVAARPLPGDPSGLTSARSPGPVAASHSRQPGKQPGSGPAAHHASDKHIIGQLGSYWVGHRWITFTEPAHTAKNGQRLGARTLLTLIRFPSAGRPTSASKPAHGPFPMIVFAPGFMQCGGPYSPLLQSWASAGYVVVVVNFPHSDCKVGNAATEADMINQPADMSYVISKMLALSARAAGLFSGLLDRHEIAAAGHSDGADTVGAIAANTCCVDYRISAVAVLSGAEWAPMPGSYFTRRPVPMLFAQGSADTINWPGCSIQMYHSDRARVRYYLDLLGASHTLPYWGTNRVERLTARVTLAFFDRYVLGQLPARTTMERDGNVSGIDALYRSGRGRLAASPCNG